MAKIYLLNDVSVDTVGTPKSNDGSSKNIFVTASNFGGGTVTIEASIDDAIWVPLKQPDGTDAAFTENTVFYVQGLTTGAKYRATLAGATGASGVTAVFA